MSQRNSRIPNRSSHRVVKACAGLAFLVGSGVGAAAEETRHVDAHEHGAARLNIAQDGNVISMEFVSPAINIVGFEHVAHDEDEANTVKEAVTLLEQGDTLFRFAGRTCNLESAVVKAEGLLPEAHHDDEHEAHHDDEHDAHHDDGKGESAHSEFEATYIFNCADTGTLESIRVGFFDKWQEIEEVDTVFISEAKQISAELTAWTPVLEIED
ncbi:MAG: DUF2796 domain-containing protein [Parvibaculum sp.]